VSSQIKVHAPFGGVVPNLAAREHLKNLPLMLKKILKKHNFSSKNIDLIAVTQGPGLIPALLIGTNCAKALTYAWKKPLIGVHHIAGHIYANFIGAISNFQFPISNFQTNLKFKIQNSELKFPILALVVSGGHTQLILMKKHLDFKIVGETLDDAAGEAFDKVARILGLGYPGGPTVSAIADKFKKNTKYKILNTKYQLPRPMINSENLNFSFSGLKTAVLYTVKNNSKILKSKNSKAALCAEFQQAVIDVLISKTLRAAKKYNPKTILLGGGVSANKELRVQLGKAIAKNIPNTKYRIPDIKYSLDNAAMIAVAGYFQYSLAKHKKKFENNWKNLEADASLALK
jgi:N6-L-threonylcarbamoyladenine synthase